MMKKGSQQTTNAPVMIASVLAALRSRFESATTFFRRVTTGRGDASIVDGSGSRPLWYDVFSGDVFVELTFVNAVVVVSGGRLIRMINGFLYFGMRLEHIQQKSKGACGKKLGGLGSMQ